MKHIQLDSHLQVVVPALVILLSFALVVLMSGGVGNQECCIVIDEHWHEEAANNIDGEEEGVQCIDGGVPQEPHAWEEEAHHSPHVEASCAIKIICKILLFV